MNSIPVQLLTVGTLSNLGWKIACPITSGALTPDAQVLMDFLIDAGIWEDVSKPFPRFCPPLVRVSTLWYHELQAKSRFVPESDTGFGIIVMLHRLESVLP